MTLIYLNREFSVRVYVSYHGRTVRLAILQHGRIPRIVTDEDEIMAIMREVKDQSYTGGIEGGEVSERK